MGPGPWAAACGLKPTQGLCLAQGAWTHPDIPLLRSQSKPVVELIPTIPAAAALYMYNESVLERVLILT